MKKIVYILFLLALAGCQTSDEEIRADIAGKAQQDLNFAGLQYTVDRGAVVFTGNCPSQKAFEKIRQTISNIHVIKSVSYRVGIAPVNLNTLTPIKLQADSIMSKYPQALAKVDSSGITLTGSVPGSLKGRLLTDLRAKYHGSIRDSLFIK